MFIICNGFSLLYQCLSKAMLCFLTCRTQTEKSPAVWWWKVNQTATTSKLPLQFAPCNNIQKCQAKCVPLGIFECYCKILVNRTHQIMQIYQWVLSLRCYLQTYLWVLSVLCYLQICLGLLLSLLCFRYLAGIQTYAVFASSFAQVFLRWSEKCQIYERL